ncbi:MAG: GNAT family N-acetyltransferase [Parcubacteria group bacterium]|nr:GNAT family N-acetyltransferase [Parcubacteria group bacterium]
MESIENFEKAGQTEESLEQKNARLADGRLTEAEIKAHWENPDSFLFENEIIREKGGEAQRTKFRVRALSEGFKDGLLESVKGSWDEPTFQELAETLDNFFEQRKRKTPALLNVEYYIATDTQDKPFAITGIYTVDIAGGAGFATSEQLDLEKHNLATRLGWFAVSPEYQGGGVGGFLFNWVEKMAQARGSKVMVVETDDYENEQAALNLYGKSGYKSGLDIKDYFGPGRDSVNYFSRVEEGTEVFTPSEKVSEKNREELLGLAKKIYSPERYQEFEVCLELLFKQKEGEEAVVMPHSFVLRNEEGKIESFSILITGIYENAIFSVWEGSDPDAAGSKSRLAGALRGYAQGQERGVVVLGREGADDQYLENGFAPANDGVPEVFAKGDPTQFLLYSKKL